MNNEKSENTTSTQETLTNNLVALGRIWARHGLALGVSALEASAKSLSKTAVLLGEIVDALEAKTGVKSGGPAGASDPAASGEAKAA